MRIRNMQVNHLTDPLGYECEYPVFSWVTENVRGKYQEKARLEIALDRAMKEISGAKGSGLCQNLYLRTGTC